MTYSPQFSIPNKARYQTELREIGIEVSLDSMWPTLHDPNLAGGPGREFIEQVNAFIGMTKFSLRV